MIRAEITTLPMRCTVTRFTPGQNTELSAAVTDNPTLCRVLSCVLVASRLDDLFQAKSA